MARHIVAGLDIGTASIRLVVSEVVPESSSPRVLCQVKKDSRGLRRGYIINPDETLENLKDAVKEAERQTKIKLKSVLLSIGGITLDAKVASGQVTISRADQEVSDADQKRALETARASLGDFPNRQVIHQIPLSFKLDGEKVLGQPVGLRGNKLEVKVLFIHSLSQHLNDLIRVVGLAGLSVDDVVAAPLAGSFSTLSTTQKMAGVALVNIGSQTTSIITFEEGIPLSLQVFPFGSNDVTNDIALGLKVSLEEAEQLKLGGNQNQAVGLKKKLDEIIEARLTDIFESVEAHLKKIGRNSLLPAGIIIVGDGGNLENIERLAKTSLRLPARLFDPLQAPQLKTQIRDASWVVAYGLCLFGFGLVSEEPLGTTLVQTTKSSFVRWIKEFWP
ncbi:cell division protein FtsA [Candidatus Nomurabacteria bacterium]|nr:cell division protein FtsA [Candidatus Nomurabacteria bacterium]